MSDRNSDELYLRQALALARKGIALTSPNPSVGAVVVNQHGKVVGSGFHTYSGIKHAEVIALEQAGEHARGSTIYVNLEPCVHQGRSGPCTEAIISAGIRRVVAAMKDPNPLVSGKGFQRLRDAGITVASEILEQEAAPLNEAFAKYIRHKTPLVTLKGAMTLDGKISPPENNSGDDSNSEEKWITGEPARAYVQELRHQNDAILVGVGTVIADDPLLTDRTGLPRRRPLLRVILDSRLRLPIESRIVNTAADDVLVICSFAEQNKKQSLQQRGIRVEQLSPSGPDGRPDLAAVARLLGELENTSVLVEGGTMVNWTALAAGVVDKIFLFYAPMILGGTSSVPFAGGPGFPSLRDAPHVNSLRLHRFGEDFAVEGYLRDPYTD
ncbi:MAG: bifunctional diaminohydroxyphosphoribosylaminopyrimidine deaminase/5-amino-6-(5-phosphoribosylamino)uracil reductase RibD [Acidobacteriaceae bacterium]